MEKMLLWVSMLFLLVFACDHYANTDIAGEWTVIELTEAGDSVAVDLSAISFRFSEDGSYAFTSTLDYREAGTYRLDGPYLFSTDTLPPISREKAVEIVYLSTDTLHLRMKESLGKERLMVLKRSS